MKRTIQELTNSSHVYNPDAGQNLWWPAYDRLTLDPAINEYVYFATQKGANNKKLSDTNWAAGGQMPANTAIGIEYLNFYYTPAAQKTSEEYSELLTALTTASFAFLINDKSPQYQRPLDAIFGNCMPLNIIDAAPLGQQNLSQATFNSINELHDIEIVLAGQCSFTPTIIWDTQIPDSMEGDKLMLEMVGERISG